MSLFDKLLKKKKELEKELANSKNEKITDEEKEETAAVDSGEDQADELVSGSLSDDNDITDYDEDEEVSEEEVKETIEKVTQILMDNDYLDPVSDDDDDDEDKENTLNIDPKFRSLHEKLQKLNIDRTLFIAPVTKKDDDPSTPLGDHVVHVSFNAAKMIESENKPENMDILTDLPAGYSLPDENEPVTEMHLRTIVNTNDNNTKWMPIFISYQSFINLFNDTFRMQIVTFEEVYRYIDEVDGITIEPGTLNLLLKTRKPDNTEIVINDQSDDDKPTTISIDL